MELQPTAELVYEAGEEEELRKSRWRTILGSFVFRRFLRALLTIFVVTTFIFFLVRLLPASRLEETSGMDPRPAYEVIAGERRWRAAQLAELSTMPMVVRHMSDQAVLEMQLVENIEREDLDPMEEAEGFQLLREKLGYTVEQIADKMGKGRGPSYVRKRMKLLDLTPESREAMYDGTLQLSTGLLVARYPAEKQAAAIKHIAGMATRLPDGTLVPAPFRDVSLAL